MKIDNVKIPKSSFLSLEKDFSIILDQILKNERLKRLLYYTSKDALNQPNLTEEQSLSLLGKNIKNLPKIEIDSEVLNYIIINFDNFTRSDNPEFRNNVIEFDIICHYNQWQLNDLALRPYKIAAELDSMLDGKRLTGVGKVQFLGAVQILLTDEFAGLCLMYAVIHGEEDKKVMPNPQDEEQFLKDFEEYNKS